MGRHENTKELFIHEALRLFSERGFDAVKISEIAKEVGCTAPALYKHYENKQKLYEALLEGSKERFEKSMDEAWISLDTPEGREYIMNVPEDEQIRRAINIFSNPLHNEYIRNFRKLMMIEQFHMPELAEMYNQRYIYAHYSHYENVFKILIEEGIMREADPYALAVTYMSPIILFIGVCDRDPSKEEWCKEKITEHIKEFNRMYRIKWN